MTCVHLLEIVMRTPFQMLVKFFNIVFFCLLLYLLCTSSVGRHVTTASSENKTPVTDQPVDSNTSDENHFNPRTDLVKNGAQESFLPAVLKIYEHFRNISPSTSERNQTFNQISGVFKTKTSSSAWSHTFSWLQSSGTGSDHGTANLAFLPLLALIFFVFGICVRCFTWFRDTDREKARGTLDFEDDDELNYSIMVAGEQEIREPELRSDTASMYDTVNSFRIVGSYPFHQHTVTSIKSLPCDSHHSVLLQSADASTYDTVQSYKAFLQKAIDSKDMDIEVELISNYSNNAPAGRSKSYDFANGIKPDLRFTTPKKRRIRRHLGGRSVPDTTKDQLPEKERERRHSEKVPAKYEKPKPVSKRQFHRRSSPAVFEPLLEGDNSQSPKLTSDVKQGKCTRSHSLNRTKKPDYNSSDSASNSDSHTTQLNQKPRRLKRKLSRDRLAEGAAKSSSHSSGHSSDENPSSSPSSNHSSSNELDSDSDVTDSGLVVERGRSDTVGCLKEPEKSQHRIKGQAKKIHRFKVSFVDENALSGSINITDVEPKDPH